MPLGEALELGPAVWDALCERARLSSPFMTWAWHRAWADTAPVAELAETEVVVLQGPDGALHALLPLRRCRMPFHRVPVRAMTWAVGDIGCPDELDVLAAPEADLSPLADAVGQMPWQVLILGNLASGAPGAERLRAALEGRGHATRLRPLWICPQLELPGSWDAYVNSLSANRRQTLRRKERGLRRDHAVTLTDYDASRLEEGWGHLIALHDRRWDGDGGGAFRDGRSAELQRRFAREMAERGRLWLSTLDVDGHAAAAWYGFASGDTVYFYQGGRDPRWERESVGLVLMGMMIQRAIERGYRAFNFLRGDDAYKQQWTPSRRHTAELVAFRAGWEGRWVRALDWAAERIRG